jgi:hypothetical protein
MIRYIVVLVLLLGAFFLLPVSLILNYFSFFVPLS